MTLLDHQALYQAQNIFDIQRFEIRIFIKIFQRFQLKIDIKTRLHNDKSYKYSFPCLYNMCVQLFLKMGQISFKNFPFLPHETSAVMPMAKSHRGIPNTFTKHDQNISRHVLCKSSNKPVLVFMVRNVLSLVLKFLSYFLKYKVGCLKLSLMTENNFHNCKNWIDIYIYIRHNTDGRKVH